jgi:hypothetical protein
MCLLTLLAGFLLPINVIGFTAHLRPTKLLAHNSCKAHETFHLGLITKRSPIMLELTIAQ